MQRKKDDLTLAYLAGVIDADGFISAHRKKWKDKIYCGPLIGIAGTSSESHLLAHSIWGGSFFTYTPKNLRHRVQYQWQAVGICAATAVTDIEPYIRSKRQQIALALEMWALISGGMHRTDSRLHELAERLSAFNLRNPPLKQMTSKADIPHDLLVREMPLARQTVDRTEDRPTGTVA